MPSHLTQTPYSSSCMLHWSDYSFMFSSRTYTLGVTPLRKTDNDPDNTSTENIESYIQGEFHVSSIKMCYCTKAQDDSSIFHWPKGSYRIAQKEDTPAFSQGYIYWDDEDKNYVENIDGLPDGKFGGNTRIYFCCRNDGSSSNTIVLPSEKDFILFSPVEECQPVEAMSVTKLEIYFDNEDDVNDNSCSPEFTHPYNYLCNSAPNHFIYPCHEARDLFRQ